MSYTLWSRGRLLGQTDLGFVQCREYHRMGWFHPSPDGELLMSVLTGPGPALKAFGRLLRDPIRNAMRPVSSDPPGELPADLRNSTEYADLVSSVDELHSMDLQVRDPSGTIMETEHVGIDDMEFKKSFLSRREQRRWDRDRAEDERLGRPPFPRYQIQVYLPRTGVAELANR